jgi:hypothetical protein
MGVGRGKNVRLPLIVEPHGPSCGGRKNDRRQSGVTPTHGARQSVAHDRAWHTTKRVPYKIRGVRRGEKNRIQTPLQELPGPSERGVGGDNKP